VTVYTRRGDDGRTNLPAGDRVIKCDARFEALGTIDELDAHLGLCMVAAANVPEVREPLEPIQAELLSSGAVFAAAASKASPPIDAKRLEDAVTRMEQQVDELTASLPKLTNFILPGGCELSARLHVARTVCRRAERRVVAVNAGAKMPPSLVKYLNRLSDLLFVLARAANAAAGLGDTPWTR